MGRFCLAALLFSGLAAACGPLSFFRPLPTAVPAPTVSATPLASPSSQPSLTPTPAGTLPVWGQYAGPLILGATPIPPPAPRISLSSEIRVLALAGVDEKSPFLGRTDALMLVLYHPRLAKAALVSIPPDLFGYLPGYGMQRLYGAYALGGGRMLVDALDYNLGVRPDQWAVVHMDDFSRLVDELGGVKVPILEAIPTVCGDRIYPGEVTMDGSLALCYARLRLGSEESARGRRQQELLRQVFLRVVSGGNLVKLPALYEEFSPRVETNLTSRQVLDASELMLKMGDTNRTAYFQVGEAQTRLWQISKQPPASVFLPRPAALAEMLNRAVQFVLTPSLLTDTILTLEYELTVSPTPTRPSSVTPTLQFTATLTPTIPPTPTVTLTPIPTLTPTPTLAP